MSSSRRDRGRTLAGLATTAVLLGIIAATADAAMLHYDVFFSRRGIQYIPSTYWPFAVVMYSALCAGASLLTLLVTRSRTLAIAAALLVGPMLVAVVRPAPWLARALNVTHPRWLALLSALVCIAAGKLISRWMEPFRFHRALVITTTAVVALSALAVGVREIPSAGTSASSSTQSGARNVVLIFLDTLRYDTSGVAAGLANRAPNLGAFSSRGVVFENAISPAPWTVPSHLSIMAGIPANRLNVDFEHQSLPPATSTLATLFRNRGYATDAIVSNYLLTPGTGFARDFQRYEIAERGLDFDRTSVGELLRMFRRRKGSNRDGPWCEWLAPEITRRALQFIGAAHSPYFLVLNYADAHDPYANSCSEGTALNYQSEQRPALEANLKATPVAEQTRSRIITSYRSAVLCMDASLGKLLRSIEPAVEKGDTLVAIVGDHGEELGEHALWFHGDSVYRQEVRVPMVIRGSGLKPSRISAPVSTTAIHDLLLRLADRTSSADAASEWIAATRRYPAMSRYDPARGTLGPTAMAMLALHDNDYCVVRRSNGVVELYDIRADPEQTHDLSTDSRLQSVREDLRRRLEALERQHHAARPTDSRFSGLGYLQ
jgi:arylsulfatase A-like enzyme